MSNTYIPSVVQVIPREGYNVLVFFDDGKIVEVNMSDMLSRPVFRPLKDTTLFKEACCVLDGTLAWDLEGNRDARKAIDLDLCTLHDLPSVNRTWANKDEVSLVG